MSELGPEARAILRAARDADDPTPADRARIRGALMASIGAGAAAATGASAAKASGMLAGKATAAPLAKVSAAVFLSGAGWKAILGVIFGAALVTAAALGPSSKPPGAGSPLLPSEMASVQDLPADPPFFCRARDRGPDWASTLAGRFPKAP